MDQVQRRCCAIVGERRLALTLCHAIETPFSQAVTGCRWRAAWVIHEVADMLKKIAAAGALGVALSLSFDVAPAQAQTGICERLGTLLKQREGIMKRINGMGRKNVNPSTACSLFGSLAANGNQTLAFATENKDWCQIPDVFIDNLRQGNRQANDVRGKACNAARQQAVMTQRARQQQQQAQQQGAGSFGGVDGFSSGPWRVPQGAL
jgi:hypothetical protein